MDGMEHSITNNWMKSNDRGEVGNISAMSATESEARLDLNELAALDDELGAFDASGMPCYGRAQPVCINHSLAGSWSCFNTYRPRHGMGTPPPPPPPTPPPPTPPRPHTYPLPSCFHKKNKKKKRKTNKNEQRERGGVGGGGGGGYNSSTI